jgi:hypothetical protein
MRLIYTVCLLALLSSCSLSHRDRGAANRDDQDRGSAAFQAGEIAHGLSKEAGKAAKAAGKEIQRDAHELREGWKEGQREDRTRRETTGR